MKSWFQSTSKEFKGLVALVTAVFVAFTAEGLNTIVTGIWRGVVDIRDTCRENSRANKRIEQRLDDFATREYVNQQIENLRGNITQDRRDDRRNGPQSAKN